MESQASCIRNELFTKMIKKVGKKKEVNLIPSVKVESAEVGGGGGGPGRKRDSVGALRYTLVTY